MICKYCKKEMALKSDLINNSEWFHCSCGRNYRLGMWSRRKKKYRKISSPKKTKPKKYKQTKEQKKFKTYIKKAI